MDREIAPKPPKVRVRWDRDQRLWRYNPDDFDTHTDKGRAMFGYTGQFTLRVNILNGRYSRA